MSRAGAKAALHLIWGEEFLVRKSAEELIKRLVPGAAAGLNSITMDGASPAEIAQELATMPLFPGPKVVLIRDPEFLAPKKGRGDALGRAREAWKAGRRKEGARRVLALVARAGWGVAQLDPRAPGAPSRDAWREELDVELAEADLQFLAEVAAYCREENVTVPEGDATPLVALFEKGVPPGHALVIAASEVDARNPLVKLARDRGELLERKVADSFRRLDLREAAAEILEPLGKRLGAGAADELKERIGGNMRLLQSELEKLAAYASGSTISAEDVRLLVAKTREDEFFEAAEVLQSRDLRAGLAWLNDALEQGKHPLLLLGALAAGVRNLIDGHERMRSLGPNVSRMSSREFEKTVFPKIEQEARESGRRVPHPYAAYKAAQAAGRYSRAELIDALVACADADVSLKSSGSGQLVLESLLLRFLGAGGATARR
ncbi:MAG TPA: DNA polymerase III subunit delta [Myxococcaceae bacterium]|nr:DNA polymerase III subunit delta [Myxococcaceae bacterium]